LPSRHLLQGRLATHAHVRAPARQVSPRAPQRSRAGGPVCGGGVLCGCQHGDHKEMRGKRARAQAHLQGQHSSAQRRCRFDTDPRAHPVPGPREREREKQGARRDGEIGSHPDRPGIEVRPAAEPRDACSSARAAHAARQASAAFIQYPPPPPGAHAPRAHRVCVAKRGRGRGRNLAVLEAPRREHRRLPAHARARPGAGWGAAP